MKDLKIKWMSVRDEVPNPSEHQSILVYSLKNNILVLHYDYGEWCLQEEECEYLSFFSGSGVLFSHWALLPTASCLIKPAINKKILLFIKSIFS